MASLLEHKELQGTLARAKGDNLSLRSEASDLRARPATLGAPGLRPASLRAPGCSPLHPKLQPYEPEAATLPYVPGAAFRGL